MTVPMTPEAVTARLRALSELSREGRREPAVDMSPTAISSRLRELSDLSQLCARLVELGRGLA